MNYDMASSMRVSVELHKSKEPKWKKFYFKDKLVPEDFDSIDKEYLQKLYSKYNYREQNVKQNEQV